MTINTLAMNGTISFPNNGAGLAWSTNSQIYDDSNLHISSNTNLLLYTPTTCIITTPNTSLSGSLTCTNIRVNRSGLPPNANYIGYSQFVSLTAYCSLIQGTYTNVTSIVISTPGMYDIDCQIAYNYTTTYPLDSHCTYAVSTLSQSYDSDALVSQFMAGKININYSSYSGISNLTNRRMIFISGTTTIYLVVYCMSTNASAGIETYLRYTRIA